MKQPKIKSTPLRMCISCKQMLPKRDLIRFVKTDETIHLDFTGKASGRGAYVCNNKDCIEKCIKKKMLNKAFKTAIDDAIYAALTEEYAKQDN